MEYKVEKKNAPGWGEVDVLGQPLKKVSPRVRK